MRPRRFRIRPAFHSVLKASLAAAESAEVGRREGSGKRKDDPSNQLHHVLIFYILRCMSDEMNRKFIEDPQSFLRKHFLDVTPIFPMNAGPYDLDLNEYSDPRKTEASLKRVSVGPISKSAQVSAPIKAFWLPWKEKQVTHARVQNESFIFTAPLSGCRFAFETTDDFVKVAHICGARWETSDERKSRQQGEDLGFGPGARKYSRSDLEDLLGSTGSNYQYNTVVVGARRNGRWRFFAQNIKGSVDTGIELKQLDVIDTHSGAARETSGVVAFITRLFA